MNPQCTRFPSRMTSRLYACVRLPCLMHITPVCGQIFPNANLLRHSGCALISIHSCNSTTKNRIDPRALSSLDFIPPSFKDSRVTLQLPISSSNHVNRHVCSHHLASICAESRFLRYSNLTALHSTVYSWGSFAYNPRRYLLVLRDHR